MQTQRRRHDQRKANDRTRLRRRGSICFAYRAALDPARWEVRLCHPMAIPCIYEWVGCLEFTTAGREATICLVGGDRLISGESKHLAQSGRR